MTGGCGFIGTNLIALLNRHGGYEVTVLDNEVLGKEAFLEGLQCAFVRGDILDLEVLAHTMRNQDALVHLAADTRVIPSVEKPRFNFNVLEVARASGIQRVVNASTGGAIIGEADPPVHETMVPQPMSPYGASKLAVEGYCSAFSASYGLHAVSLRFSNVYGPRSFHKGSVVAEFLRRVLDGKPLTIYGDGSQTRDYVFVEDLCEGIVAGLTRGVSGVFQLGTGEPLSLNALVDIIRDVVAPRPVTVHYSDFRESEVRYTYCDISKAKRDLSYNPTTAVREGISRTWEWFLDHGAFGRE